MQRVLRSERSPVLTGEMFRRNPEFYPVPPGEWLFVLCEPSLYDTGADFPLPSLGATKNDRKIRLQKDNIASQNPRRREANPLAGNAGSCTSRGATVRSRRCFQAGVCVQGRGRWPNRNLDSDGGV